MSEIIIKGQKAKKASTVIAILSSEAKNDALKVISSNLIKYSKKIITANNCDIEQAEDNGVKETLIDRLILNEDRIKDMSEGITQIISLSDPIGEMSSMKKRPNGLMIGKRKVPLGVIGIIYEARPNVTVDAFSLCFKTGNVVILRGGKEAINSNKAIVDILRLSLQECGITKDAVQLVNDTRRDTAIEMMKMNEYLDVLIPRGGAGLIQSVIQNSTVPVIETGVGNCHIYVDEYAKFQMALDIIVNAKTQRPGVCNACESLVINKKIANNFLPLVCDELIKNNVEIRGDKLTCQICRNINEASEEDFYKEYLDYIISIKVVDTLDEAIDHINEHNTKHSEAIITENYTNAQKFLDEVDAAAVYVNASTRFTDGFEFGFGAEIGISTQKLHARGPMGLEELTTTKYIIYGNGQIRK